MESCCVEEFFPSAEIEGIWGFTSAMAMVGGVSLVIFLSLFKWMDWEEKSISNGAAFRQEALSANTGCFVSGRRATGKSVWNQIFASCFYFGLICIFSNHNDMHERGNAWTSHRDFESSTLRFYSLFVASSKSTSRSATNSDLKSFLFSAVILSLVFLCPPPPPDLLSGISQESLIILQPSTHMTRVRTPWDGFL